jgi:hypothetical protein
MRLQVLYRNENPVLPVRLSKLLINKHLTVTVQLFLSRNWTVTVRPLLRFLTISWVIELRFKLDWSRWKAKTLGYKFSLGRRTSLPPSQSKLLINKYWTVIVQLLLSRNWTVTVRPHFRFLTISRVIEFYLEWDWSRWKAKTRGYKFSVGKRTQFCPLDCLNCSSTNIWLLLSKCYCLDIEL